MDAVSSPVGDNRETLEGLHFSAREEGKTQESLEDLHSSSRLYYTGFEFPCIPIGNIGSYETPISHPLILNPKEEIERTGTISLSYEKKLIDAIIAAHIGIAKELPNDALRYFVMAITGLMAAKKRVNEGMAARVAINAQFSVSDSKIEEASEGDAILDLPGHRNACFIAHDNLFFGTSTEELNRLVDSIDPKMLENPRKALLNAFETKDNTFDELTKIAFSNFIDAKNSGIPVMIFSARSLPIWVVPYIGIKNISSIVLPSEEYTKLGHLVGYLNARTVPIAVISGSKSKREAKMRATEVANGLLERGEKIAKSLIHSDQNGTFLVGGRALDLFCYSLEHKVTKEVINYESEVTNRDGNIRTITVEVDSIDNLEAIKDSNIEVGLVKSEFLLPLERDEEKDPSNFYDFSEERLTEIYEAYLTKAGNRRVTFRLADEIDESGEKSQDVKPTIPLERRPEFRDRQVRALSAVAKKLKREIGIMIPNFKSKEQFKGVCETVGDNEFVTVIPMIESTAAIKKVREMLKDGVESKKTSATSKKQSTTSKKQVFEVKEVALGIGDFTADVAEVDSRYAPSLDYPAESVLGALREAAKIGKKGVGFTVCGDRTADPKILLLLEAAGVRKICTGTSNYTRVRESVERMSGAAAKVLARGLQRCSNMGGNPKESYDNAFKHLNRNIK